MTAKDDLATAEAEALAARQQLTRTMVDIQSRLNPRALVREALDEAREMGSELLHSGLAHVRQHPAPLIGIGATIAGFVARNWLVRHTAPHTEAKAEAPAPAPAPADDTPPARPARHLIKADTRRPPRRKR